MQIQGYDQRGKMEENGSKIKEKRMLNIIQICLRAVALLASIASTWLMFISHQTSFVYDVQMSATYSYSPTFKFFAFINAIASVFGLLSLSLTLYLWRHGFDTTTNVYFFIHDLVVMSLILGGFSSTTAVAYIGKYGNSQAGWIAICDHFNIFCGRIMGAIILCFLTFICFLSLTLSSSTFHLLLPYLQLRHV